MTVYVGINALRMAATHYSISWCRIHQCYKFCWCCCCCCCLWERQTDRQNEPWSIYVWSTAFRSWPFPSPILKQDLSSCFSAMFSKPTLLQALGSLPDSASHLPPPPRKVMGLQILTTVARLLHFNSDPEVELGTSDLQNTELSDDSKTWFLHSRKLKSSKKENKYS